MSVQEAELKSIRELNGKTFIVPAYQRGFRWNKQQIRELIDDLNAFSDPDNKEGRLIYCLQPIVLREIDNNKWELIDGQQRLTALYLLSIVYKVTAYYKEDQKDYIDYNLSYEKKYAFEKLLKYLKDTASKLDHTAFITHVNDLINYKKILIDDKTVEIADIDSQNVLSIVRYLISDYQTINQEKYSKALNQIFRYGLTKSENKENGKDICVIWHELKNEDIEHAENNLIDPAIELFSNLNANKISLTEAELIKAILLHSLGERSEQQRVAHQWESIERELCNDSFWYFFIGSKERYRTRIDFLFEVWYATEDKLNVPEGDHVLLRAANIYLNKAKELHPEQYEQNKDANSALLLWNAVVEIFETLRDWYDDYYYYHMIGLLVEVSNKKGSELVRELFAAYHKELKKSFVWLIHDKVKDCNAFKALCMDNEGCPEKWEDVQIKDLTYGQDNIVIKNTLLLLNVAILVNAYKTSPANQFRRFPFEYYKNTPIEIEHINAQHPDEKADLKAWCTWFKSYLEQVNMLDMLSKEEKQLLEEGSPKQEMVAKWENVAEIHSISNLTLLDKYLNDSKEYSNHIYEEKRNVVIGTLFPVYSNNKVVESLQRSSVILPATEWIYTRMYSNESDLPIWSKEDREAYVYFIQRNIYKLLFESIN